MLILNISGGLDSASIAVEFYNRNIRPDLILFADTGGEWPETYRFIGVLGDWFERIGWPPITVCRYEPTRAPYHNLESKCFANQTLPSLAFGGSSCSTVFKRDVMIKYMKNHPAVIDAIARGERIVKALGYDDGKSDRRRRKKADAGTHKILHEDKVNAKGKVKLCVVNRQARGLDPLSDQWEAAYCDFWYPLQDWGLTREDLPAIIRKVGLPVPRKSACFYCPAMKPGEVVELKLKHPELFARAVAMERGAREGKHGLTTKAGLGLGGWAWEWLTDCNTEAEALAIIAKRSGKVKHRDRP